MDKIELGFLIALFLAVSSLGLYSFIDYEQESSFYPEYDESVEPGEEMILSVKDESGNPVSDAEVKVGDEKLGTTGSDGLKQFTALDSDFNISLRKEGFEQNEWGVNVIASQGSQSIDSRVSIEQPSDVQIIESFGENTEVDFEFMVGDRDGTGSVTVEIMETGHEFTRPISSYQRYESSFEDVPASTQGENYNLRITGDKGVVEEQASFEVRKIEPQFNLEKISLDGSSDRPIEVDNYEEVEKEVELSSDLDAEVTFQIFADEDGSNEIEVDREDDAAHNTIRVEKEKGERISHTSYFVSSDVDGHRYSFERDYNVGMRYRWKAELEAEDEIKAETEYGYFEVTKEP